MSDALTFYNVHEQSAYKIVVSKPENLTDISDLFISSQELMELIGRQHYVGHIGESKTTILCRNEIEVAVRALTEQLQASGKRALVIEDNDLLEILTENYPILSSNVHALGFCRRGNRIAYLSKRKRVKHRATQGDVRDLWNRLGYGFYQKYGSWLPYIARREQNIKLFKALKSIVGWRRVRKQIEDKQRLKFARQIWDKPEEFM